MPFRHWTQALTTAGPTDATARGGASIVILVVLVLLGGLFLAVLAISLRRMRRLREGVQRKVADENRIDPWRESARRMHTPPPAAEE